MPSTPPIFSSYAAFSAFMSSDTELSLYRTFHALSSRNLLYLQSSLLGLENRLKELDEEDLKGLNIDNFFSAKCWETFSDRAKEHPREAERMELIMMIKKQIKEYRMSLVFWSIPYLTCHIYRLVAKRPFRRGAPPTVRSSQILETE
jgi:hypothetical protein